LSSKKFSGKEIVADYTIWGNDEKFYIKIPHLDKVSKKELIEILSDSDMTIEQFEKFIGSTTDWNFFDQLIDMSLNKPSLKHPKNKK